MTPPARRTVLRRAGPLGLAIFAGCLGPGAAGPETSPSPEPCSATEPPRPTTAEAPPEPYPAKPAQLTTESVRSFVRAYEQAYQYNEQLARHPDKLGRLNELNVDVREVVVDAEGDRFVVGISGQLHFDIVRGDGETPETPTVTPLPIGHGPFEASYVVSGREVRREGVVVECW